MLVTDLPSFINQHHGWHAPGSEKLDLLVIKVCNAMSGIGQADKGKLVPGPIFLEGGLVIRTHYQDYRIFCIEFVVISAQLRHMPAAEWSKKAAIEDQDNILLKFVIGKTDWLPIIII
jgi:hypothetical protein